MQPETRKISLPWQIVWLCLGVPLALLMSLGLAWNLWPATHPYRDLTQDWLSTRCFFNGLSIYTPHSESAPKFLGETPNWDVRVNAHPPTSVLLLLPLGLLSHPHALLVWNLLSLLLLAAAVWIVLGARGLDCEPLYLVAAGCLLVCSTPLAAQVKTAQFNSLLALLIALVWIASRQDCGVIAGALVGCAASLKLFPGFLLLYFLGTRQWKALWVAVGTVVALHVLAVLTFGAGDVVRYFRDVVPQVSTWQSAWVNCSLTGFWSRLFNVTTGDTRELIRAPGLARILSLLSSGLVTALVGWRVWNAQSLRDRDLAFAATVLAMLLVSPITWDHYLLMLVVPVALLWHYRADTVSVQLLLAATIAVFMVGIFPAVALWRQITLGPSPRGPYVGIASPWQALGLLALPTYSLLLLLMLSLQSPRDQAGHLVGNGPSL
jgi:Glycosyltransferase family 87